LNHGADAKKAKMMSLFIEEMAVNIVKHGLAQNRRKVGADYRLSVSKETLCLTLRDFCEHFDPVAFYKAHNNGSSENMLGISIVMKLAKDTRYFNAFNSNNIIISI
jgi:anti-sigma regulatory factor (Ser/Thr protein kinase)